jgi:AcrR family transcriptional regulator
LLDSGVAISSSQVLNSVSIIDQYGALTGTTFFSSAWINQETDITIDRRPMSAPTIIDILLKGIATKSNFVLMNPPDFVSITARDFNAFDIQDISNEKRLQLIGTASRLFNQRGIEATSIEDVATALGATKGAVYHYFENKNQLLMACYERAFELYDQFIEASEKSSDNPVEIMMTIVHLNCQAQASRYPPLIFKSNPFSLPDRFTKRALEIRRRSHKTHIAATEQSLCRGDTAIVDVSVGAFLWVQKWVNENQFIDARLLADEVCSIYGSGLLMPPTS